MVMTFWLVAGLILVVALILLIAPMLKPKADSSISSYDASVAIHRQRLETLQQQHTLGALGDADFQQACEELEITLLEETRQRPTQAESSAEGAPQASKFSIISILILVPVLSIGLYAWLGNYRVLEFMDNPAAMQALAEQHPPSREQIQHMVNNLKLRVRQAPNDSNSWELLGRAQFALEQYAGSADSYGLLIRINGENADRLTSYAEAASMANKMQFTKLARERLEQALTLEPRHPKALMLGALAAMQSGNKKLALDRWKILLPMHAADSEQTRLIKMLIAHTEGATAAKVPANHSAGTAATPESAPAVSAPIPTGNAKISVELSLAPALRDKIKGSERVFVFARPVSGPPMPVAVKVLKASDLPVSLTLDDSNSMPSGRHLSSVRQVQVGARISFSGNAIASAGDLEGTVDHPLNPKENPEIKLVIDQIHP